MELRDNSYTKGILRVLGFINKDYTAFRGQWWLDSRARDKLECSRGEVLVS